MAPMKAARIDAEWASLVKVQEGAWSTASGCTQVERHGLEGEGA